MTPILLLVAAGLVALNGFFVGAEFAVLAARRARLEQLPSRSRRARSALRAIEQLPLMISGCQFGITMASLGLGALAEPVVAELLTGLFQAIHIPINWFIRSPWLLRSPSFRLCTCCWGKWFPRILPWLGRSVPR